MSDSPRANIEQLRAALWRQAGPATLERAASLELLLAQLDSDEPEDVTRGLELAIDHAHAVAGSAGVHGLRAAARAANRIEALLRTWDGSTESRAQVRELIAIVRSHLGGGDGEGRA